MTVNPGDRPDLAQKMAAIEVALKEAQAVLNETDDECSVRANLANLMDELKQLSNSLRVLAQGQAPTNDEHI